MTAPWWSTVPRHAVSVLVTPATTIVSSSVANPTVLTALTPHGLTTGDTVLIAGHTGSTPAVDGARVVTVLTPTTFSVPVNVSVSGTVGTVTRTTAVEPLTLTAGKLRAGLDWTPGDARDALMSGFIAAARSQVEQDTGLALLSQTRDLYFDALPSGWTPLDLPSQSRPLQSVISFSSTDTAGAVTVLDPVNYTVDVASGRIALATNGNWPTNLRQFQPLVIRIVSGWTAPALLPSLLVHAVGLLTAHYATLGRDLASTDSVEAIPYGYDEAIMPHRLWTAA